MNNNEKILVGQIVAPQGIRGDVRVQTYTAAPEDLRTLPVFGDNIDAAHIHFVRRLNPTSSVVIIKVQNINDRNAAETLRGTRLYVMRGDLPETSDNEYYQADLIGMHVIRNGTELGIVAGFQNFGAGDIIETENGDMISFVGAVVDMKNKTITVK